MPIDVKVVAHSRHPGSPEIYTLQMVYPRIVHAEFMTHRVFSRNASSSRAIPAHKMIAEVEKNPAMPVAWGKNQPGMQARELLSDMMQREAREIWLDAAKDAVKHARRMDAIGAHKQIVNRILEPFAHISVVCTGTDWSNFFKLRDHPASDPTVEALARAMRVAMTSSKARYIPIGGWHLPYISEDTDTPFKEPLKKGSAARCARVSYNNHDGSACDLAKDMSLADMLLKEWHMSPFEHQATPAPGERHANFQGWESYRSVLEDTE